MYGGLRTQRIQSCGGIKFWNDRTAAGRIILQKWILLVIYSRCALAQAGTSPVQKINVHAISMSVADKIIISHEHKYTNTGHCNHLHINFVRTGSNNNSKLSCPTPEEFPLALCPARQLSLPSIRLTSPPLPVGSALLAPSAGFDGKRKKESNGINRQVNIRLLSCSCHLEFVWPASLAAKQQKMMHFTRSRQHSMGFSPIL